MYIFVVKIIVTKSDQIQKTLDLRAGDTCECPESLKGTSAGGCTNV